MASCPICGAALVVTNSIVRPDLGERLQYISCRGCRYNDPGNPRRVPLQYIPPRVNTTSINRAGSVHVFVHPPYESR